MKREFKIIIEIIFDKNIQTFLMNFDNTDTLFKLEHHENEELTIDNPLYNVNSKFHVKKHSFENLLLSFEILRNQDNIINKILGNNATSRQKIKKNYSPEPDSQNTAASKKPEPECKISKKKEKKKKHKQ